MWVEQDEESEINDAEEDEEEVLPSVFDKAPSAEGTDATLGNESRARPHTTPSTPLKRPALSDLTTSRKKVSRQMGYIERLAAGILQEGEEDVSASPPVTTAAGIAASSEDRIAQLEDDLDTANAALDEKTREVAELELKVEELQTQLAS